MIIRESNQKEIIEFAQDIKSSSKLLLSIINDILDFSKIESGKTEIICVQYDLRNLLHDEYIMFSTKVKNKGLQLKFDIDLVYIYKLNEAVKWILFSWHVVNNGFFIVLNT